jgi:hypothetical protein
MSKVFINHHPFTWPNATKKSLKTSKAGIRTFYPEPSSAALSANEAEKIY